MLFHSYLLQVIKRLLFQTGGRPPVSFEFFLRKEYQKNMNP
jgi:hypothetical protein